MCFILILILNDKSKLSDLIYAWNETPGSGDLGSRWLETLDYSYFSLINCDEYDI